MCGFFTTRLKGTNEGVTYGQFWISCLFVLSSKTCHLKWIIMIRSDCTTTLTFASKFDKSYPFWQGLLCTEECQQLSLFHHSLCSRQGSQQCTLCYPSRQSSKNDDCFLAYIKKWGFTGATSKPFLCPKRWFCKSVNFKLKCFFTNWLEGRMQKSQ